MPDSETPETAPGRIAELEEHARRLERAEERLRQIVEATSDALVVVDLQGTVQFANRSAERLLGQRREDLVGSLFGLPLVSGETTEIDLRGGRMAEMRSVESEWAGRRAWVASLRDVTERRDAEVAARRLIEERTARRQSERERLRLEELLAKVPAAICTTRGADLVCVFANPGMMALAGGRELVGRPLGESLPELGGQGFVEGFVRAYREGEGHGARELELTIGLDCGNLAATGDDAGGAEPDEDGESERDEDDGEVCYLDVTWQPLRQGDEVELVMCFAHDVTEQVVTRHRLEAAMRRLRLEDRRKDQFMAVLGHELRNPLAGIGNGLRLLAEDIGEERRQWALEMMNRQVALLGNLLDDLLDVSRIARGKMELRKRVVAVDEMLSKVAATVETTLAEREHRLEVALPEESLAVEVDPSRFEQVLTNLLINASKYSPHGESIAISARREAEEAVVDVADHGVGIESEMLEQIFEPFIQGNTDSPVAGGLGIGLTLVKRLIELHAGSVSAASQGRGMGSTFTLRLPLADPQAIDAPEKDSASQASSVLAGKRVLVVDDNVDAARALLELLRMAGSEAAAANDGEEALRLARESPPDIALLDLDLPKIDGYGVAVEMRRDPALRDCRLIALSGFGDDGARERSRASGIDHHMVKPIDFEGLVRYLADGAATS